MGVSGALATTAVVLYAGRHWWLPGLMDQESAYRPPLSIPAGVTWRMVEILPALVILGALIVLAASTRGRFRRVLQVVHASAQSALPILVLLYIAGALIVSADRAGYERRMMEAFRPGPEAGQVERLEKSGFIVEDAQ